MRTVLRTNYENFANAMVGFAREGDGVCCVTYEQNTYNLLKELLAHKEVIPCGIDVQNESISGYDKEYYIMLTKELYLFIEPAYHEDNEYHKAGYYEDFSDMIFVDEDVRGEVLVHLYPGDIGTQKVQFVDADNFKIDFDWNQSMNCGECSMDCGNCGLCGDDAFDDGLKVETVYELLYDIKNLLDDFFD